MKESTYADLSVIGMKGCEEFAARVDYYLKEWRRHGGEETFLVDVDCPRFSSGEAKGAPPKVYGTKRSAKCAALPSIADFNFSVSSIICTILS